MKDGAMKQTTTVFDVDEPKRFCFGNRFIRSVSVCPPFDVLEKRHGRRAGREIREEHAGSPTYGDVLAGACSSGEAIRKQRYLLFVWLAYKHEQGRGGSA